MPKMSKGLFKKWALENKEAILARLHLEQAPPEVLHAAAAQKGHEVSPRDTRRKLVQVAMGDVYPEFPKGYNARKVCRVLGLPTRMARMASDPHTSAHNVRVFDAR